MLNKKGFTLIEVVIAMGIMAVALAGILVTQSNVIRIATKSKENTTVAMLLQRAMVEAEQEFQGQPFNEIKEEASGTFDPPFDTFRWSREIKEIKFPDLNLSGSQEGKSNDIEKKIGTIVTKYMNDSLREVVVTISWEKAKGTQKVSASTYWINLNNEFQPSF